MFIFNTKCSTAQQPIPTLYSYSLYVNVFEYESSDPKLGKAQLIIGQ